MKNLNTPEAESPTLSRTVLLGRRNSFLQCSWYFLLIFIGSAFCYFVILKVIWAILRWLSFDSSGFSTAAESCFRLNDALGEAEPIVGACYPAVWNNLALLFIGRYPVSEAWRIALSFALLLLAGQIVLRIWRKGKKASFHSATVPLLKLTEASPLTVSGFVFLSAFSIALLFIHGADFLSLTVVPPSQWGGLALTLLLSTGAIGLGFPLALVLALCRASSFVVLKILATTFIECIRGVPLVTLLFCANYLLPLFLPPDSPSFGELVRAQAALVLFSAAYLAEVIRGGLAAVDSGQREAASALGLGQIASLRFVVLPQALRAVLPALVSTFIGLIKDTSLVSVIGLFDLLGMARLIPSNPSYLGRYLEPLLFAALIYLLICTGLAFVSKRFELQPDEKGLYELKK